MSVKKNYTLTSRQQLVDLNGDTTNFDLSFVVKSIDGSPFYLIVVDQNTLDNNPNLDYKHVENGSMSGNIISDKNIYENYYLCLKSDKDCEVQVTIDKREIPVNIPPPPAPKAPRYTKATQLQPSHFAHPIKRSTTNWKLILIVIIVICGGLYLYYLYNKKKDKITGGTNDKSSSIITLPIVEKSGSPIIISQIVEPTSITSIPSIPSVPSEPLVSNFGFTKKNDKNSELQSLIQRLNNLPVK